MNFSQNFHISQLSMILTWMKITSSPSILTYLILVNLISHQQTNIFPFLHVNTRSLCKNFDQLQSVLSGVRLVFDLIGITDPKQQIEKDFITNVDIIMTIIYILNPLKEQQEELQFMPTISCRLLNK